MKTAGAWRESLERLAARALGEEAGRRLPQKYHLLFTAAYQALVPPCDALRDMLQLERIASKSCQRVSLLKPCQKVEHYRLHFYSRQERFLDEYIPVLENLQLRVMDQVQFPVKAGDLTLFIKSFTITAARSHGKSLFRLRTRLLDAIQMVMDGSIENDALNKLIVLTGMNWREIDVLRAYRNYYLQLGQRTSRTSIHHALLRNPQVAQSLFNYFEVRFRPDPAWDDPVLREEQALFPLRLQLLESVASVSDINDDRILRTLFNLIDATVRSNFHSQKPIEDYFFAIKINSLGVIEMPVPKPQFEIYVHAVDMEGIHMRAGRISRGGIRWSDRPDDFRTEILGLMQTQISKNALIIPTGAKGGFVVKKNGPKADLKSAGRKAYIKLVKGLLDLTDNYTDADAARPPNSVAYDDPDPYLVVAADKGTAQFSDIANSVSADYRFWLGDAFASGGSHGYNHKALGITARGAWECVKRHFRELGKDIQNEAFTVVGIGSMDGDVFGNGMLLSPCIRLLAAFSGQHIFIDPDPADSDAAFNERKRLFELPGSSWNDYDRALISKGGGVYPRSAKDIPVSSELKKWLGIRYKFLDGESLIRYLLTAPVDLLWLGGIGTYVKASTEKHEDVGDRANDNVRIDAAGLAAKVVGEGANLGFTQKARIQYGLQGGRINTDAVDNSAGVDTSDHEVNLKIFLAGLQKKRLVADYRQLFADMTVHVCRLVLADNYAQSLCLSLDQLRCAENPADFLQLADHLENAGFLDRAVESFPQAKEVLSRPGRSISRPELAVLMAASKMYLTRQIEAQPALIQQAGCDCYLDAYFPAEISVRYKNDLSDHPLANEIKATFISNKIINQAGCGFLNPDVDSENMKPLDYIGCYLTFDRVLQADAIRQSIYALDNRIGADRQYQLLLRLEKTLAGFCRWAVSQERTLPVDVDTINCYSRHLKVYEQYFTEIEAARYNDELLHYRQEGVPDDLALSIVLISSLDDFPFIVSLAADTTQDFEIVLRQFNETSRYLGLDKICDQLAKMPCHDHWERKVSADIWAEIKRITGQVINDILASNAGSSADYFELPAKKPKLARYWRIYQDIDNVLPVNLLPYVVLSGALRALCDSNG